MSYRAPRREGSDAIYILIRDVGNWPGPETSVSGHFPL